jgi:hypothetical protein
MLENRASCASNLRCLIAATKPAKTSERVAAGGQPLETEFVGL